MLLGSQYFREPGPSPDEWEFDFKKMEEIGLDLVRYWVFWSTLNPSRDNWEWNKLDKLFDLASQHGLGVIVQLVPENQPRWFVKDNADLAPRDAAGLRSQLMGHTIAAAGAYPGITFEHAESSSGMSMFIEMVVERYKNHPAMHTWDVWNEIQPYSVSCDDITASTWHTWLHSRFVSVDAFRAHTQVDISNFEDVPLLWTGQREDHGNGTMPLRAVYREWLASRMVGEMSRRASLVRSIDSEHPVASHRRGATFRDPVIDDAELANTVDMWGTSHHVAKIVSPTDFRELAMKLAMARGASSGKPFWLAEIFSGRLYHGYGHYSPSAGELRSSLLLAFAHGAFSAVLWQYRHEGFGSEMAGWGLVNFDGSLNERTAAVSQVSTTIRRLLAEGGAPYRQPSELGVLYDASVLNMERSIDANFDPPLEASITEEVQGWFMACQDSGSSADVFTPSRVIRDGLPSELRVLIAPLNAIDNEIAIKPMLDWVRNGGTLVLTAFTGMLTNELTSPSRVPTGRFGLVLDTSVIGRDYPQVGFEITLAGEHSLQLRGHLVLEELEVGAKGKVLGTSNGKPVVVETNLGKGRLLYIASLPGIGYLRGGGGLSQWISRLLPQHSLGYSASDSTNVVFERMRLGADELLFAFNTGMDVVNFDLLLTSPGVTVEGITVNDFHSEKGSTHYGLSVPAGDCVLLRIGGLPD